MSAYTRMLWTTFVGVLASIPTSACAQVPHDSLALRNDCKRVEQILKTGHPLAQVQWAVNTAGACGLKGAEAGSEFIRSLATSYTAEAGDAARYLAAHVQAREVYEAGLTLAMSPTAGTEARIVGFIVSLNQVAPGLGFTPGHLRAAGPGRRCADAYISAPGPTLLSPVPADAGIRLKVVAEDIRDNAAWATELRNAAGCIAYEVELALDTETDD